MKPGRLQLSELKRIGSGGSKAVNCPRCRHPKSAVIDSRATSKGCRRRRICVNCDFRFTTYETIVGPPEEEITEKSRALDKLRQFLGTL